MWNECVLYAYGCNIQWRVNEISEAWCAYLYIYDDTERYYGGGAWVGINTYYYIIILYIGTNAVYNRRAGILAI